MDVQEELICQLQQVPKGLQWEQRQTRSRGTFILQLQRRQDATTSRRERPCKDEGLHGQTRAPGVHGASTPRVNWGRQQRSDSKVLSKPCPHTHQAGHRLNGGSCPGWRLLGQQTQGVGESQSQPHTAWGRSHRHPSAQEPTHLEQPLSGDPASFILIVQPLTQAWPNPGSR